MFKDFRNKPIQVGDKVLYVSDCTRTPHLAFGTVTRIYSSEKACTVDSSPNVYSERIVKLPIEASELTTLSKLQKG